MGALLSAHILQVGGRARSYELFVPAAVTAPPPLVVLLHGRLGSAAQVRRDSAFDEVAKDHGFVVAYPDGVDGRWTDLRQVTLADHPPFDPHDVDFLVALVDTLVRERGVDARRVFVMGHSNGAIMALTLACLHADRLAGIAIVAGDLPATPCAPSRAVPALFFHGTEDPLVRFGGGPVGPGGARGFVRSSDETVDVFAKAAGCKEAKRAPRARTTTERITAIDDERMGCSVPVKRVILDGGGHGWPGHGPIWMHNTRQVDASAEAGRFFAALPAAPL